MYQFTLKTRNFHVFSDQLFLSDTVIHALNFPARRAFDCTNLLALSYMFSKVEHGVILVHMCFVVVIIF